MTKVNHLRIIGMIIFNIGMGRLIGLPIIKTSVVLNYILWILLAFFGNYLIILITDEERCKKKTEDVNDKE